MWLCCVLQLASEEANAQRLKMLLFGTRRDRKGRIYLKVGSARELDASSHREDDTLISLKSAR
jgi:hypothetical protein